MRISKKQISVITSFSNDVAKGIMVAVILGQGLIASDIFEVRMYLNVVWFVISMIFFSLAIFINKSV